MLAIGADVAAYSAAILLSSSTAFLGRPALGFTRVTGIVLALALKFTRTSVADLLRSIRAQPLRS